jgi:hypothetical protein
MLLLNSAEIVISKNYSLTEEYPDPFISSDKSKTRNGESKTYPSQNIPLKSDPLSMFADSQGCKTGTSTAFLPGHFPGLDSLQKFH